jgi:hypothetical protein
VNLLEPVTFTPRFARQVLIWSVANHRLGRREAAIQGMEWLNGPPARHQLDASRAYMLKTLADNQDALGRAADAKRSREQLADLWKNADADVPLTRR